METRRAHIGDMKDILNFMEEYHKESNLADIPFDRPSACKMIEYFLGSKDTLPLIATNGSGQVTGLLFGTLEPFFFNKKCTYGTDLMFISKGGGPALFRKFKAWALGRGAKRIMMGISSGDPRADQLMQVLGMTQTGGMYVLCS